MAKWGFRPPLYKYELNWAGRTPEDGEMNEVTLPSGYSIRNSNPGGLRPSTLPLGHGCSPTILIFVSVIGEETFFET